MNLLTNKRSFIGRFYYLNRLPLRVEFAIIELVQAKSYLRLIAGVTMVLGLVVLSSLFMTNPTKIGPIGVTLWFVGFLTVLQGAVTLLLYRLKKGQELEIGHERRLASSWRQGFIVAVGVTICIALSSLRQLSLRDVVLLLILGSLVEFYMRTRR